VFLKIFALNDQPFQEITLYSSLKLFFDGMAAYKHIKIKKASI